MTELQNINEQIHDTKQLLEQIENPGSDKLMRFIYNQDNQLLSNLMKKKQKIIIESFKETVPQHITSPADIIELIYTKEHFGPIDPFYIAEYFGFKIDQNYDLQGDIGKCEFDGETIRITYKATQPVRDKFTIAHELGHVFVHFSTGIDSVFIDEHIGGSALPTNSTNYQPVMQAARNTTTTNTIEAEANEFAGQLLVPRAILERLLERIPDNQSISATLIKKFFHVSTPVLEISLKKYGLLFSSKINNDLQ